MPTQKVITKAGIFTGSDLRSFGGGEKDILGWVDKVNGIEITIYSLIDDRNIRLSYDEIRRMLSPRTNIVYYSAYRASFLRDLIPLTSTGLKALWSLRKFDVIYSMHQGLIINSIILVICKIFGVKYVLGIHSPIFFDEEPILDTMPRRILTKIFSAYRKFLIRRVGFVRIQNKSDEKNLMRSGYTGLVYNIPPHVYDDGVFDQTISNNRSEFIALFVGRLSIKHKGIDLLEEIVDKVVKNNEAIYFHIVGSGYEGKPLIEKLATKYQKNLKWKGFLSEELLNKEYAEASLFVFPSRGENFGISLAEAQVKGLPAIAFKVMGSEDIITSDIQGTLVHPLDTSAFASAVLKHYESWSKDPEGYLKRKLKVSMLAISRFNLSGIVERLEVMLGN